MFVCPYTFHIILLKRYRLRRTTFKHFSLIYLFRKVGSSLRYDTLYLLLLILMRVKALKLFKWSQNSTKKLLQFSWKRLNISHYFSYCTLYCLFLMFFITKMADYIIDCHVFYYSSWSSISNLWGWIMKS